MSRMKLRWLWIVVCLEVLAISGILIWGLGMREPAKQPAQTPAPQTTPAKVYKTPKIELSKVAEGFAKPVTIAAMADKKDARLFVVEQGGTIRVITAEKTVEKTPFLDLRNKVKAGGEMGLLGLAFHPKAAQNHFFYVNYVDKSQYTVIARYTISTETERADPASEKVLLRIKQPYANHNGGGLAFGPNGYLFIGMGDGGSGGDPENRAQNLDDLLGKMLRIDVDGGNPYSIPKDNPFAKDGGKPEIWAFGLRNPWRFSFDRKTGDLFIADVGQGDWEEINMQPAKVPTINYGWRCYEGSHSFKAEGCQNADTRVAPIIEYDHSEGRCSVSGGYVYRGTKFPALTGKYFYGDYCGGQLYTAVPKKGVFSSTLALATGAKITTFGEDSMGELYMADYETGTIYQITDTAN